MSRTIVVVFALLVAGCAAEPQAAPPIPAATVVPKASTTTTTTAPTARTEATTTSTTTTSMTVPPCELGTALDAVWMVETGYGHGTAFHIGDGEWITAAHVVGDIETLLLRHGADEIEATVVGIDYDTDVAVLDAATGAPSVPLALNAAAVGADVLAAGYPLYGESEPSVTRGVVSRLERDSFLGELLLTDTAMNPGNSGGPLFTECGDVAGMVIQKIVDVDVEGIGYAVTASELTSQMPRLRSGYRTVVADPEPVAVVPATTIPVRGWYMNYVDGIPYAQADALVWDGPQTTPSSPPQLWVTCLHTRKWLLYWPHAYIYTTPGTDLVATDWLFDDGTEGYGSWYFGGDDLGLLAAAGWSADLDAAARSPNTSTVFVVSYNGYWEDNNIIGSALFPLDGYAETLAVLDRDCP